MKKLTFFVAFFSCVVAGTCFTSWAADKISTKSGLAARVMYIDLDNDLINVAEKKFVLLSHLKEGNKVWDTRFVDKGGGEITPEQIKPMDRVRVISRIMGEKLVAMEIVLLDK